VQTSHNEFSPPVQRKHASPPIEPMFHRPSLGRAPTGFNAMGEPVRHNMADYESDEESEVPQLPDIDTRFAVPQADPYSPSSGPMTASTQASSKATGSSDDPMSPVVVRQRDRNMQESEGMALRRASTLLQKEDEREYRKRDSSTGLQPSPQFYNTLANISTSNIAPTLPDSLSPETALSPGGPGPSPFDDPR
jgi:hypothetical protein